MICANQWLNFGCGFAALDFLTKIMPFVFENIAYSTEISDLIKNQRLQSKI